LVIHVVKTSGEAEPLRLKKVRDACLRTGASPMIADEILHQISKYVYDGISTREIYKRVYQLLKKYDYPSAIKFRLKKAIMRMGPSGFPFEDYVCEILKGQGYRTRTRVVLRGACVGHEIDIIAEEGLSANVRYMVECKYHNALGIYTGLKEVLYTYARFLDLREGFEQGFCERLDGAWLLTNTKLSLEAIQYGNCKGLRLIGWRYPPEKGLENLIEEKGLYPITILESIDRDTLGKLARSGIILVRDLQKSNAENLSQITDIPYSKLMNIYDNLQKMNR
jgi:hypothetical protein